MRRSRGLCAPRARSFHPTALFAAGVLTTALSIWLYARPDDFLHCSHRAMEACRPKPPTLTQGEDSFRAKPLPAADEAAAAAR